MNQFFNYGEKVKGYDVRVINEREARAAAGILFAFGILSLTNAVMLSHEIVTKFFITFFLIDFFLRVINPNYSPSMLLGRFFVQNQTPEYVGAAQKRFAWLIGLMLAIPMFYLLVINPVQNPIKVVICIICLFLLLFESAFSICLGCKIYNIVMPEKATHCPGGVCEIKKKDKIQTFNMMQKSILILTVLTMIIGTYMYVYKLENKTMLGKMLSIKMMSAEEIKSLRDKKFQQESEEFDDDSDF